MGGICGVVLSDSKESVSSVGLRAMAQALRMGDEGEGKDLSLGSIGFAVQQGAADVSEIARLSIAGRDIALALFGAIYGVSEGAVWTQEPASARHVLDLYIRRGIGLLQDLRGDFVVVIWDGHLKRLYLATDRFRVHPIFYSCENGRFVFASRMKGLLAGPYSCERQINPGAIVDFMASSMIATPATVFRRVHKLPPGSVLTFQEKMVKVEPYWNLSFLQQDHSNKADLARRLKEKFMDAVSCRLKRDGQGGHIGTFLSGGIDSSTVTGVLTHLVGAPIKSFSIAFDEDQFNEISYARLVAKQFGSELHEYTVTPEDTLNALPILIDGFDEPFGNASSVPTYYCAKMAKEHGVRVLYGGDGGDELFGGNKRYSEQRVFDFYHKVPAWLRGPLIKPLVFALAELTGRELFVKGRKYINRASIPYPNRLYSYGFFMSFPLADLFNEDFLSDVGHEVNPYEPMHRHYFEAPASSELDRQLYLDLKLAISDNDLFKVTRMTQAAGVVVRFPFLDHCLAEFAATIPANTKMKGSELRSFFKYAYADLLPQAVLTKFKHGFGLPIPVWLQTDKKLRDLLHDLVLSRHTVQRGYFKKSGLDRIVELHQADPSSVYGAVLWNLMILELWHRKYVDRDTVDV